MASASSTDEYPGDDDPIGDSSVPPPADAPQTADAPSPPDRSVSEPTSSSDTTTSAGFRIPFVSTHWRGEYPLGFSYWVCGVAITFLIVGILIPGVEVVTASPLAFARSPRTLALCSIGLYGLVVSVWFWQMGGLWRSALTHISVTKRYGWARIVQCCVLFAVARSAFVITENLLPQSWELARIAAGLEHGGFNLAVLPGGTELEVSGVLGFGVTKAATQALAANPKIRQVRLNSHGGRAAEGVALGEAISSRKLDTYTSQACDSACVFAFLGGQRRIIFKGASLGFHQPSFPGLPKAGLDRMVATQKALLSARGVAGPFISRALATPAHQLYLPSVEELQAAHVVTEVLDPVQQAADEIFTQPGFRAIREHLPTEYSILRPRVENALRSGAPQAKVIEQITPALSQITASKAPQAEDQPIRTYTAAWVRAGQEAQVLGGEACSRFLLKQVTEGLPHACITELEMATAGLLESAVNNPQRVPKEPEVAAGLDRVGRKLNERYGTNVGLLLRAARNSTERTLQCTVFGGYYEEILALPPAEGSNVMRFLWSQTVHKQDTGPAHSAGPATR